MTAMPCIMLRVALGIADAKLFQVIIFIHCRIDISPHAEKCAGIFILLQFSDFVFLYILICCGFCGFCGCVFSYMLKKLQNIPISAVFQPFIYARAIPLGLWYRPPPNCGFCGWMWLKIVQICGFDPLTTVSLCISVVNFVELWSRLSLLRQIK